MTTDVGVILCELGTKAAVIKLRLEDDQCVAQLVSELVIIFDAYPNKQTDPIKEARYPLTIYRKAI